MYYDVQFYVEISICSTWGFFPSVRREDTQTLKIFYNLM